MDLPCRSSLSHLEHGVGTLRYGMDSPVSDSKGGHQHKRHWPVRDPVEGGGGSDRQLLLRQPVDTQRPPQVQYWKRDRDGYNGAKALPGSL